MRDEPSTQSAPLRVVIIDDQPAIRLALRDLLSGESDITVVAEAQDGEEGLKVVHTEQPDAVLLDLEMPRLDGFAFLRLQMAKKPVPVVVVSSHATRESVFRALELGAMEFVAKPLRIAGSADLGPIREDLLRKLRLVRFLSMQSLSERMTAQRKHREGGPIRSRSSEDLLSTLRTTGGSQSLVPKCLVCIGASTGGPPAILSILQSLHPQLPVSVLVTQHMPEKFTAAFVERLKRTTPWPVREADAELPVAPGEVVVASASYSLCVYRDGPLLRLHPPSIEERRSKGYVPSIDRMMEAAATAMGPQVIGVILTGMSGDGIDGILAIRRGGGRVLAEEPQSAVVASMPEEAIRSGAVQEIAPLRKIPDVLTRWVLSPGPLRPLMLK